MKKIIGIMLLVVMAVSLVACGSDDAYDGEVHEKYEALINAIENGDEALAKEEFEKFFPNSFNGGATNNNNDSQSESEMESEKESEKETETESEVVDPAIIAFQEIAACEWKPDIWSVKNRDAQAFTLYEDGTCDIRGEALLWEIDYVSEESQDIVIYRNEDKAYSMSIRKDKDVGYYSAYVSAYAEDDKAEANLADKYYATSNLNRIEITIDNWQEYFDIVEAVEMDYDAFGEPYRYYVSNYIRLKDEYGNALADISDVAVEYSNYETTQKVFLNYETKEYTLEAMNPDREKELKTHVSGMQNWYIKEESRYGIEVVDFYLDCMPEQITYRWEKFEGVSRILGYVYVVNE